jgi:preprotein translocase subunit SecG
MFILLTIVHVFVCVFLIIVVLLQSGKAADLAGAFGGMGSQTAFGPRGSATLLSKATTISAILFMITSLGLSVLATGSAGPSVGKTVLEQQGTTAPATQPAPAAPAPAAPAAPGVPAGQPSVTFEDPSGKKKTVPLQMPPPGQTTPVPAQPAAPAAPANKK